jgi:hypothetical protein
MIKNAVDEWEKNCKAIDQLELRAILAMIKEQKTKHPKMSGIWATATK